MDHRLNFLLAEEGNMGIFIYIKHVENKLQLIRYMSSVLVILVSFCDNQQQIKLQFRGAFKSRRNFQEDVL